MAMPQSSQTMLLFVAVFAIFSNAEANTGFRMRGSSTSSTQSGMSHILDRRAIQAMNSELEDALAEVLGGGHGISSAHLNAAQARIQPTFDALPKNGHGHIDRDALKYLVHRYFVSRHGWNIKGFENNAAVNTSDCSMSKLFRHKLPGYVESFLEAKLAHHGFAASDVVTMVVALERLIFDEGVQMLESSYALLGKKTGKALDENDLQKVLHSFMVLYALQSDRTNATAHEGDLAAVVESFPDGWAPGDFARTETKALIEARSRVNPFMEKTYSFDFAAEAVTQVGERFGQWQNSECRDLRNVLTSMDKEGTGRVRLANFYNYPDQTAWIFQETPEYLRNLGALDETSPSRGPQLIIPNYVLSMSNCLEPSDYYSICCVNECEGILGAIESEVRSPLVSPTDLADVVQNLLNSTQWDEPRNLTLQLREQLDLVAEHNEGKVPIHGRLFAQWLHYVFPHECPFPHKNDAHNPLTSTQWVDLGREILLSEEEMAKFTGTEEQKDVVKSLDVNSLDHLDERTLPNPPELREMSQWSMEEELYVKHTLRSHSTTQSPLRYVLGGLAKLGLFVGVCLGLKPLIRPFRQAEDKRHQTTITSWSASQAEIFV